MLSKISTSALLKRSVPGKGFQLTAAAAFSGAPQLKAVTDPTLFGKKLDEHGEPRFLEQVKYFIDRAAKSTTVPDDYMEIITTCNATIRLNLPLVRDDGTIENVTAYR